MFSPTLFVFPLSERISIPIYSCDIRIIFMQKQEPHQFVVLAPVETITPAITFNAKHFKTTLFSLHYERGASFPLKFSVPSSNDETLTQWLQAKGWMIAAPQETDAIPLINQFLSDDMRSIQPKCFMCAVTSAPSLPTAAPHIDRQSIRNEIDRTSRFINELKKPFASSTLVKTVTKSHPFIRSRLDWFTGSLIGDQDRGNTVKNYLEGPFYTVCSRQIKAASQEIETEVDYRNLEHFIVEMMGAMQSGKSTFVSMASALDNTKTELTWDNAAGADHGGVSGTKTPRTHYLHAPINIIIRDRPGFHHVNENSDIHNSYTDQFWLQGRALDENGITLSSQYRFPKISHHTHLIAYTLTEMDITGGLKAARSRIGKSYFLSIPRSNLENLPTIREDMISIDIPQGKYRNLENFSMRNFLVIDTHIEQVLKVHPSELLVQVGQAADSPKTRNAVALISSELGIPGTSIVPVSQPDTKAHQAVHILPYFQPWLTLRAIRRSAALALDNLIYNLTKNFDPFYSYSPSEFIRQQIAAPASTNGPPPVVPEPMNNDGHQDFSDGEWPDE